MEADRWFQIDAPQLADEVDMVHCMGMEKNLAQWCALEEPLLAFLQVVNEIAASGRKAAREHIVKEAFVEETHPAAIENKDVFGFHSTHSAIVVIQHFGFRREKCLTFRHLVTEAVKDRHPVVLTGASARRHGLALQLPICGEELDRGGEDKGRIPELLYDLCEQRQV